MTEPGQYLYGIEDDGVRLFAVEIADEAYAAGVFLVFGVIKSLSRGKAICFIGGFKRIRQRQTLLTVQPTGAASAVERRV